MYKLVWILLLMLPSYGMTNTLEEDFGVFHEVSAPKIQLSSIVSQIPSLSSIHLQFFVPTVPFFQESLSSLWYGHIQGNFYHQNRHSIDGGVGYRTLIKEGVVGGYNQFGCYHNPNTSNSIWYLKPGIEIQKNRWGFNAQGYLPLGKNEALVSIIQRVNSEFKGHQEIGIIDAYVESMPLSIEVIGSWSPNLHWKALLGGYYLHYPNSSEHILGVFAGICYIPAVPALSFEINARYDQSNQFHLLGQISLLLEKNQMFEPSSRLVKTPALNIITLKEPVIYRKTIKLVQKDNIYFYSPNGSPNIDCTYETPCNTLVQSQLDAMPEGATLYVASGEYSIRGKKLKLHKKQSLFGCRPDFSAIDSQDQAPCINAQLSIKAKGMRNKIEISNLNFKYDQSRVKNPHPSLVISSSEHVYLNQIYLYTINRTHFPIEKAILIEDSANITIKNSTVSSSASTKIGIMIQNSENIHACSNFIQAENTAINLLGSSKKVEFKRNTFQSRYNALTSEIKILDIANTVRQFKSIENQFNFGISTDDNKIIEGE